MTTEITYRDAGVDIDAMNEAVRRMKEAVRMTYTANVLTDVGSFGGMFRLGEHGMADPVLVSSIDSVGTKVKIAAMMKRYDTIGRDLVNHCSNDILVQGARPLFFLDYFATSKLDPQVCTEVVRGLAEACRDAGCALIGGETAELPGVYLEGELDLAGCIVGIVERSRIIDGSRIMAGDVVIGLASSGLHTNGYSLARKILFETAGLAVDQAMPELGGALGDVLLEPHRSYLRPVLEVIGRYEVHGIAHITGGGYYDNIPRILPVDCQVTLERRNWPTPPIFSLIQEKGGVEDVEMYRTFNMGLGMVLIVPREQAAEITVHLNEMGEQAWMVGEVHKGPREVAVL